jgi:DNA primase
MWPIRDSGRQVLGFGARRLFEDDRMPSKYINTPETLLYKKSHVLYGLELARSSISKKSQAVVVEGYTDVMAAHLSGVDTAVASCGTAFGDDHARLLRRLMGNHDAFRGEVIFTFDGDAAGQAAALQVIRTS